MLVWILLLATLSLWWFYTKYQAGYWARRGIPHDNPYPIIGSLWPLLSVQKCPGILLKDLYYHPNARKAPVFGFHIFGKPAILLRDPEVIKQVIIKDFNYFSDRFAFVSPHHDFLSGRNLFFVKGKYWRALRVTMTPTFTSKRMREMFPLANKCAIDLVECLKNTKTNDVAEFREITARGTTDVILSCAFGIDAGCLTNEDSEFRKHGKAFFEYENLMTVYKIFSTFFAPHFLSADILKSCFFPAEATNFLRTAFIDTLESRKKNANRRGDLIDLIIEMEKKGSFSTATAKKEDESVLKLEGDDLLAQAAVYFVAGFETTSSTITFALDELARSPDVQQKLRDEIQEKIKKFGSISYESIAEMTYLDQVINETLRMYPPLPFLDREVSRDYKIPNTNIVLEKGTPVYVALEGLHYDAKYFPNPEVFDPDRFSEKQKNSRPAFTHLPFGEGPRNCIGSRFGLMVSKCMLANVLSNMEVFPDKSRPIRAPVRKIRTIMTQPMDGINLKIRHLNTTLA